MIRRAWERIEAAARHRRSAAAARWVRSPLGVLTLAATASALCGFCLHPQGFVLAAGLATLIAVGIAWPRFTVLGLRGTLSFARSRAREGEPVAVRLALVNRSPGAAWGLAVDAGLGSGVDAGLDRVAGRGRVELAWDFVPDRRGAYPEHPPRIGSDFPFGLARASRGLAAANSLLVWPRTFDVGPVPQAASGPTAEGSAYRDRPGGSGDFLGVRPYRRGDSLRRVHWPQTARVGQVVVCELQASAAPRVQVVLDLDPARHAGSGPDGSREWAIRIAASFAVAWSDEQAEVELVVAGRAIAAARGSVAARRAALLDALARLGADDGVDLPALLDLAAGRPGAGGLRVVVATDLAVARLAARSPKGWAERFAVLQAAAFDPAGGTPLAGPLPVAPWARVDDPARVAHQIRRAWKEATVGR